MHGGGNLIENYKFKINVTIDNEWNGLQSFNYSKEITLTYTCKVNAS